MNGRELDVVGVGAAIVDSLEHVDDAFLQKHNIHKSTMTLVSSQQIKSLMSALGTPAITRSGGSVANSLAGLAGLGAKTGFIGKVASDAMGTLFSQDLSNQGIQFYGGAEASGHTAQCLVMVTPDAERTMCTDLGVAGTLVADDIDEAVCARAKYLYLEGYMWDTPENKAAFLKAMQAARGKVALTLSDPFCVERHRDSFLEIIQNNVDVLFANSDELLSLYQTDDFDAACQKIAPHVEIAAVTRGEQGARILSAGQTIDVPASSIEKLVDTTGAGDLFASGFLYGLLQGDALDKCGQRGCVLAAAVIQVIGARLEVNQIIL
jgi:fructokinase